MQKTQRPKSNTFLTIIMIVACLFTVSVFMYKNVIDKTQNNKETTIESIKKEQFNVIWSSLIALQLQSEKKVTEISQNIEKDILNLSQEELEQLKEDMSNDVINQNLHEILNSNIKGKSLNEINNHMNGIVVMTIDGYMEDFNYHRANTSNNYNIRLWETTINNSYNKELEKDAIDKILNRNSGIIALESFNLIKDDNHVMINELTYDSLLDVFFKEGINGLRNYQIFVPYYITDFGDIFGTPDILHGAKINNNKLIVAQEFNLYDQIMQNQDGLFNDDQIRNVATRYTELLRLLYIFGISLIGSVTCLILYLFNIYNNLLYHESKEEIDNSLIDGETQDN